METKVPDVEWRNESRACALISEQSLEPCCDSLGRQVTIALDIDINDPFKRLALRDP